MKYLIIFIALMPTMANAQLIKDTAVLQNVQVTGIRANTKTPVTVTNFNKAEITKANIGQDVPYVIQSTPGLVVNSDAGTGIGYTNMRLRGTDATRLNITINGIPYNDAESQGTFLVDLPDIASSTESI